MDDREVQLLRAVHQGRRLHLQELLGGIGGKGADQATATILHLLIQDPIRI